jgi:DNA gyrase subunit A
VRGIALGGACIEVAQDRQRDHRVAGAERDLFQKQWNANQRAITGEEALVEETDAEDADDEIVAGDAQLSSDRYAQMDANQQFVLTVNEKGYGKRSSSYQFSTKGRGGKGNKATDQTKLDEIGKLVAAFPVEPSDQIMLVSDGGQLIRVPVEGIRIASRASKGVRIFWTADGEKVVSVEHISDIGGDAESDDDNGVA